MRKDDAVFYVVLVLLIIFVVLSIGCAPRDNGPGSAHPYADYYMSIRADFVATKCGGVDDGGCDAIFLNAFLSDVMGYYDIDPTVDFKQCELLGQCFDIYTAEAYFRGLK
jgi:hypothetical protein